MIGKCSTIVNVVTDLRSETWWQKEKWALIWTLRDPTWNICRPGGWAVSEHNKMCVWNVGTKAFRSQKMQVIKENCMGHSDNATLRSRNTIIRKAGIPPSFLNSWCNNFCCLYLKEKLQCMWIKQSSSKLEFPTCSQTSLQHFCVPSHLSIFDCWFWPSTAWLWCLVQPLVVTSDIQKMAGCNQWLPHLFFWDTGEEKCAFTLLGIYRAFERKCMYLVWSLWVLHANRIEPIFANCHQSTSVISTGWWPSEMWCFYIKVWK